jgi:capsular polysaccharide transport system permease protein
MPPEAPDAWADVIRPVALSRPSPSGTFAPHAGRNRRRRWMVLRFLLLVLLPTLASGAYFYLLAPSRYVSETKFLVRKPNSLGTGPAQSLSIEEGPKGIGTDDSYAVHDYLLSRDAVKLLLQKADLRAAMARAGRDPIWQFPSLLNGDTDEDLFQHYLSLVSVDYESSTGVTTLHVEAFRPQDAHRIATVLVQGGEDLLNRLNARARADAVKVAGEEVAKTKEAALATEDTLTAFRTRENVIDPTQLSTTVLSTIGALELQLVDTAAQLDVTQRASPNSPQIAPLRGRVRAFQTQIDHERATLAGSDMSFAPKIANYERLTLRRDFAERSFVSAMNLMEAAQLDVLRQQEYLETVVEPGIPDKARYPYRMLWTLVAFASGMAIFLLFRPPAPPTHPRRRPA